jgi:hypothetical protein
MRINDMHPLKFLSAIFDYIFYRVSKAYIKSDKAKGTSGIFVLALIQGLYLVTVGSIILKELFGISIKRGDVIFHDLLGAIGLIILCLNYFRFKIGFLFLMKSGGWRRKNLKRDMDFFW